MTPVTGTSLHGIAVSFAHEDSVAAVPRSITTVTGRTATRRTSSSATAPRTIVFDSATQQVTSTKTGDVTDRPGAGSMTLLPPPNGADFREETIYFAPTARFYDGDASRSSQPRPDSGATGTGG